MSLLDMNRKVALEDNGLIMFHLFCTLLDLTETQSLDQIVSFGNNMVQDHINDSQTKLLQIDEDLAWSTTLSLLQCTSTCVSTYPNQMHESTFYSITPKQNQPMPQVLSSKLGTKILTPFDEENLVLSFWER